MRKERDGGGWERRRQKKRVAVKGTLEVDKRKWCRAKKEKERTKERGVEQRKKWGGRGKEVKDNEREEDEDR